MFNIFNKAKKVDINEVSSTLLRRHYSLRKVNAEGTVLAVEGKYTNNQKQFKELYLHFVGDKVQFKDPRGYFVSKIPQDVPVGEMYSHLKNIFGLV